MLTKLSLKNIKSYKNEGTIKFAPLTLIYGPNSAGKSTLWKFLIALKESLNRGSGISFLNFNRISNFANSKTISFDPKLVSEFSLGFSGGLKNFDSDSKNSNEDNIRFTFDFVNTDASEGITDKYNDTITDLKKYIESDPENFSEEKKDDLKKRIDQLLKYTDTLKEAENILTKKFEEPEQKGVIINELKIFKKGKLFATYKIHRIDNADYDIPRYGRTISREQRAQKRKRYEAEIYKILKLHFGNSLNLKLSTK